MTAARSGTVQTVTLLIDHGADINATERAWSDGADVGGRSTASAGCAHAAGTRRQCPRAIGGVATAREHGGEHQQRRRFLDVARRLVGNRVRRPAEDLETAAALLDAGANVNDSNAAGTSALVIAAHSDHGQLARFLLSRSADPNAAEAGYTALHAAVLRGNLELVKALLEHGAEPNAPVRHGTPGRRLSADYSLRHQMVGANGFWLARFPIRTSRVLAAAGAGAGRDGTATASRPRWGASADSPRIVKAATASSISVNEQATLAAARIAVEMSVDVMRSVPARAHCDAARQRTVSVIEFLVKSGADQYPEPAQTGLWNPAGRES
jgi:hypothetical protein